MPDYFCYADTIREATDKFFDVSLPQIERDMDADGGAVEYETVYYLQEVDGGDLAVPLKLNLSCRGKLAVAWSASVKLHSKRIDGIDWHARYRDTVGQVQEGWHRHEFDAPTRDDRFRVPVEGFDGIQTRVQFLGHAFRIMGILLNGVDHGTDELPFS